MKIKKGGIVGALLIAAGVMAVNLPSWAYPKHANLSLPAVVNLDIPPIDTLSPEDAQHQADARAAIHFPQEVHDAKLASDPERAAEETLAMIAILEPEAFLNGHPLPPEVAQAEAAAAEAILNPRPD